MKSYKTVDDFITGNSYWRNSLLKFREILLATELTENIKWGAPVYSINGKNVISIGAFKAYVGIWFFQGVFLKDPHRKLVNAQEGVTKAMRQLRFISSEEIDDDLIRVYIAEAIQNQKEGKEFKPEKKKALVIPDELIAEFESDKILKATFDSLSLFKQREYAGYISGAKLKETKLSRLEKIIPMMRQKVGLNDKYRK